MNSDKIKILLVEDDDTLRFIVKDNLEQYNYNVEVAEDGEVALELFNKTNFDLILLDVMLPKIDGFQVAKTIRRRNEQIPIIFLTARSMTEDRIIGLTLGGDDYIPKPFSMEELLLKIKIFLKRSSSQPAATNSSSKPISIGNFNFYPDDLTLSINGNTRTLTLKESELIRYFATNSNKVLSRNEILENIWGSDDYFLGRSLDVFISRLRKYFNDDPNIKITNLHGIGFRFSVKKNSKIMSTFQLLILVIVGIISGLLAGAFGIGGAIIVIPALVFILGLSQHEAQGTSLAFMLPPVGILATWNYWKAGQVNWKIALILSLTFVVGAYLGSQFSINVSDRTLRRLFGFLMILIAIKMIFSK